LYDHLGVLGLSNIELSTGTVINSDSPISKTFGPRRESHRCGARAALSDRIEGLAESKRCSDRIITLQTATDYAAFQSRR
jgi:hypothetical protein